MPLFLKKHYFPVLISFFLIYSTLLIFKTSFVFDGVRYFILSDDAMISMRYGYNFAHGLGLVWNPGEFVEGFTNPLWTLFMAIIHFLPIPIAKMSLIVQIAGVLCMMASLYFIKRIASIISNSSFTVTFFSVLFTAFYFPLINWTIVQGMEVGILTLFLSSATFLALKSIKTKKFSLILFIILGIGTLVRIDFFVSSVIISLFLVIFERKNRKKYFFIGIPIILFFVFAQTSLRIWYYHDILPNTYYVKLTGYPILNRIIRGLYVLLKSFSPNISAVFDSHILQLFTRIIVISMLVIPFLYAYAKRNKQMFLLLTLFSTQMLYSVYVGGDVWEYYGGANRFVAFSIPLFFISLIYTTHSIFTKNRKYLKEHLPINYKVSELSVILLFFVLLSRSNVEQLSRLFLRIPQTTLEVNMARLKGAYQIRSVTNSNAKIGAAAVGVAPYFNPDRYFIDLLGKTEKTIARGDAVKDQKFENILDESIAFQPGHVKWDYPYVVKKYNPDIFSEIYPYKGIENTQYLLEHGYVKMKTISGESIYYVRKGSRNIKWENLKEYRESKSSK